MASAAQILTFEQYATIRHPTPYVVDVTHGASRLVLFGCQHTSDPLDSMFDRIESTFRALAPTYALHEGTPPAVEPEREIAIRRHGEAGLVRHLAALAKIPTASLDVPLPDEAQVLRSRLPLDEALVFLVVRQLASFNRKTARMDFDAYFGEFFELIAAALGLAAIDWPMIESAHLRVMTRRLQPREVTARETNPMLDDLPTQRIARLSNRLRDEHILQRLRRAQHASARVFATIGVSHAVMLEPALREF